MSLYLVQSWIQRLVIFGISDCSCEVQLSFHGTFLFNVDMCRGQSQSVRGQNDWPASTSKAGSPRCHAPLHLWDRWRDDGERRGTEEEEHKQKVGFVKKVRQKKRMRMRKGHINKEPGGVREKTVRKQRRGINGEGRGQREGLWERAAWKERRVR